MSQAHKITGFLGMLPRTAERLLPDMVATIAQNVNLTSGEIRPLMKPMEIVASNDLQNLTAYRAYNGTTEKWRRWTLDVDVARGPYPPDVEQRYYWTGDGCPRYATFTNFGTTDWALGLPKPTAKPSVTHTGGVGSAVTRVYRYTYYQPSTGEEFGASPVSEPYTGKVDGTWTISNFSSSPPNSGTFTGVYAAGSTVCTTPTPHFNRVGDVVVINSADCTVTAATSLTYTVAGDVSAYTGWARKVAWNTAGLYQRLYRSAGTNASYQLVAERAVSTANWTDTLSDADIMGDELISEDWEPPHVNLKGLICLPNGATVGFYENELWYSEPYQPHAYPPRYRYQTESQIVGIAAFGTTVVAATETRPYTFDGVTPDAVTPDAKSKIWPCKSKRSVSSAGDGVVYSTDSGLAYIGQGGSNIFTRPFYTVEEWRELGPSTMMVRVIDNRVYILHTPSGGATKQILRLDMGEQAALTTLTGDYNALYADPLNSYLYLVGKTVDQWDAYYGTRYDWVWKSKEIELPEPTNFGAAKIEFVQTMSETEIQSAYAIRNATIAANEVVIAAGINVGAFGQAEMNGDPINGATSLLPVPELPEYLTYTLYSKGRPVFSKALSSSDAFRLPAGFKTDAISHQLSGNVHVKSIKVAETMTGLKAL